MALKNGVGFPGSSLWIPLSSGTSTGPTPTPPDGRQEAPLGGGVLLWFGPLHLHIQALPSHSPLTDSSRLTQHTCSPLHLPVIPQSSTTCIKAQPALQSAPELHLTTRIGNSTGLVASSLVSYYKLYPASNCFCLPLWTYPASPSPSQCLDCQPC